MGLAKRTSKPAMAISKVLGPAVAAEIAERQYISLEQVEADASPRKRKPSDNDAVEADAGTNPRKAKLVKVEAE